MRKPALISMLAVLHVALGLGLFLRSFGAGMGGFDSARPPSFGERLLEAGVAVFHFPLVTLGADLPADGAPGAWGHVLGLLNGLLWATVAVTFWARLRRPRAKHRVAGDAQSGIAAYPPVAAHGAPLNPRVGRRSRDSAASD